MQLGVVVVDPRVVDLILLHGLRSTGIGLRGLQLRRRLRKNPEGRLDPIAGLVAASLRPRHLPLSFLQGLGSA
eukprot:12642137-Alexandrium_andersonii.AAC.1